MLRQTQPYIEFLSDQLSSGSPEFANLWKEFFECIEDCSKDDQFSCQKMIQIFKKIQLVHCAVQGAVHDCPDYKVFQEEFIGRKQAEEIQSEIDRAHLRRFDQSFLPCLQRKVGVLKQLQDDLKSQELTNSTANHYERGQLQDEIELRSLILLFGIEQELSTFFR